MDENGCSHMDISYWQSYETDSLVVPNLEEAGEEGEENSVGELEEVV